MGGGLEGIHSQAHTIAKSVTSNAHPILQAGVGTGEDPDALKTGVGRAGAVSTRLPTGG